MLGMVRNWFDRIFAEEETVVLLIIISVILLLILSLGHVLIPIIASTVLAFLMQGGDRPIGGCRRPALAGNDDCLRPVYYAVLRRDYSVVAVGLAAVGDLGTGVADDAS